LSVRIWRHPRVDEDLLDIWLFIARDNVAAADRVLDHIEAKFRLLADHPEIGRARPDIAPAFRMLPVLNYLVLYKVANDRIEIVRVVHGARSLEILFS